MRKPFKTIAVVLAAVVAGGVLPAAAHAAPKAKPDTPACEGKLAESATAPYLFGSPLFAGRALMGTLIVPDNRKITVDAVADSWSGLYHNTPGSRDAFRLRTEGLSYLSNWTQEVLPLDGMTVWVPASIEQNGKWLKCEPGLPVVPFSPIG